MSKRKVFLFLLFMSINSVSLSNDMDKYQSISIMKQILEICEQHGMLACENQLQGLDAVYKHLHMEHELKQLESTFELFIEKNYPTDSGIDFEVLHANYNMLMDFSLNTNDIVSNVLDASLVKGGYDVKIGNTQRNNIIKLRQKNGEWVMIMPAGTGSEAKALEPFYYSGQLKRVILIYRMYEAKMAKLSKSELEKNINTDLAPIVVSLLGEEKTPALMKWLAKDINDVVKFYSQFKSTEDMKRHIVKIHNIQDNKLVN